MGKNQWCCPRAAWLVLVAGCSGISHDTSHEFDAAADFSKVRTFDWLAESPELRSDRDALLFDVIGAQLTASGLRRDTQAPDVLVAVHRSLVGVLNTKKSGYEWRDGRLDRYQMQEGTLVIDLVGAKDHRAVWRGTAAGTFRADATPDERRAFLTDVLRDMFADYPPR